MTEMTSQPPVKQGSPSPILLVFLIIPLFGIVAAVALAISEGGFGGQPIVPTPQAVSSDFVSLVGQAAPDFSLGYICLADSYLLLGHHLYLAPEKVYGNAHAAVEKALELDPNLAEAYATKADFCFISKD